MDMNTATLQQYQSEDMTIRLENGRVFHYWLIGMTPLNSGRNAETGTTSAIQ